MFKQMYQFLQIICFFNSITKSEDRALVANLIGVRHYNDPERHLGLPNMVGRCKKASF